MTKKILVAICLIAFFSYNTDDPLEGIDKNQLFASPTKEEIAQVIREWKMRDLSATKINVIQSHEIIKGKLELKIITYRLAGLQQYAGVLLPITTKPLPVHLFIYGFDLEDPTSYRILKVVAPEGNKPFPFVYIIPSLRGQILDLKVNDLKVKTDKAEGERDNAFDGAADDGIGALNAAATLFPGIVSDKVFAQGGSRGGTVALLMAERDPRIKLAAGVAFPSDLIGLTAKHQKDPTYKFQFLNKLIDRKETLNETRKRLIASSPLYFCESLPKTQMHFGEEDQITPPNQGELLIKKLIDGGIGEKAELFIYKDRHHLNIGDNNEEMIERIKVFYEQLNEI